MRIPDPRSAFLIASLLLACAPTGETMPPPADTFDWAAVGQADEPKKDDADVQKWDVNAPPGPSLAATIDTDEGTWMSLDVSPDGEQIAFDLLGDIYVVSMSGGEAEALTAGMAWDMQPRYSPDGKWIAFTSDRAGGDNVWIMPSDGGDPKQVTKEDFRLVNSPTWSPDGQFIAARKHFTSQRSLGAGEIWLYHVTGGKGLQMTEKPTKEKDVGEPVFSPDGRYVYYSQDVTPGESFEYNKDPYREIYAIQRLDRKDGHTERFVSGPGGAVRPTPSHDGTRLAFVRRVGTKTALFIHHVESGAERPIYGGLDRDMQETWAIHGVYPTMAWTPDDTAIVAWAGGKIHRIDVATGNDQIIPFHVKHTRKMIEAVRVPVEVHPAKFDTKMLRWVQVAPDGTSVVYQALGHIYVRSLPDGAPRRLTTDAEYELYPSFSRDGRRVVYVSWDDQALGSVHVVSSRGGRSRTITNRPGHYVEPAFSPDGSKVVFRAVSGGWQRSREWSHETGLFWVPAAGGADAQRISRSGTDPHFGADDDRVFFMDRKPGENEDTVVLKSLELDGSDEITHLDTEHGTEFHVSPDGRWVAFREQFKAHVAPFPPTGKTVKLKPKSEALPVATVTQDAGEYLHWSGDSQRLFWAVGPELFSRDLRQAFAFIEGAPEKVPEPARIGSGTNIGFSVESDVPTGKIALVGGRIVTMKGDEVIEDGTIVVDRNRIAAVGPSARVKPPTDAKIVDVRGNTVIPGLIDVHAHGSQGRDGIIPQQNWLHYATLAFGVTTIHDPSHHTETIFAAAEMARAGMITAPRIFSTGTILYGAKASIMAVVDNLDDARGHLRRMKAVGAFTVKSYNQPRRDQRQQILTAARELEMMVVPEGGSLYQHDMTMVVDGHTGIEHAIPIARGYKDMIQLWSATKVGYTPTIVVGYGGVWGDNYWYQHTDVYDHERLHTFVPPHAFVPRSRRRMHVSDDDWNHIDIARLCKKLGDAGVMVLLGAHGQREGLGAHWELWMFVQGGMTPLEAIRAGTLNSARYLGLDGDIGSLEVGKLADLAVIDGNPLDDIRVSENVRYTMVNGRLFDAATMHQIGNHPEKRKPFYWER